MHAPWIDCRHHTTIAAEIRVCVRRTIARSPNLENTNSKQEIWGTAQREAARRCKSDWVKILLPLANAIALAYTARAEFILGGLILEA